MRETADAGRARGRPDICLSCASAARGTCTRGRLSPPGEARPLSHPVWARRRCSKLRPADYSTRLAVSDLGRAYKRLVIAKLDVQDGAFVVDLVCGPGADLAGFADGASPSGRVLGIGSDPSAVAAAEEVAKLYRRSAWSTATSRSPRHCCGTCDRFGAGRGTAD